MILTYGKIFLISIIIIIILFFIIYFISYLYSKYYLKWDKLKVDQLDIFMRNNNILTDDFNFLSEKKKKCFFKNFTQNVPYSEFKNVLDIRSEYKKIYDKYKIQYLNDNNDYQTFLLKSLKFISKCLSYKESNSNSLLSQNKINNIDSEVVYNRLKDKMLGSDKIKKEASEYIAKQLNDKDYTLIEFNYLYKFYIDPDKNKSSAPVIKNFVNFLTKINKWK